MRGKREVFRYRKKRRRQLRGKDPCGRKVHGEVRHVWVLVSLPDGSEELISTNLVDWSIPMRCRALTESLEGERLRVGPLRHCLAVDAFEVAP